MTDETTTVCTICGGSLVRGLHAARTTHISIRTCIKALRARAEAAEKRLAEFEAAARWRPVSEKPVDDKPVLALLESGEYKVARYVDKVGGVTLRYWRGTGGSNRRVAHWRPIVAQTKAEQRGESSTTND